VFWMILNKPFRYAKSGRINYTISEIVLLNIDNFPLGGTEKDA
jgi:hypothetical protein